MPKESATFLEELDGFDLDILARINNLENLVQTLFSSSLSEGPPEEAEELFEALLDSVKNHYKLDPRMDPTDKIDSFLQWRSIDNMEGFIWRVKNEIEINKEFEEEEKKKAGRKRGKPSSGKS